MMLMITFSFQNSKSHTYRRFHEKVSVRKCFKIRKKYYTIARRFEKEITSFQKNLVIFNEPLIIRRFGIAEKIHHYHFV